MRFARLGRHDLGQPLPGTVSLRSGSGLAGHYLSSESWRPMRVPLLTGRNMSTEDAPHRAQTALNYLLFGLLLLCLMAAGAAIARLVT
jgi:hypothetical protein